MEERDQGSMWLIYRQGWLENNGKISGFAAIGGKKEAFSPFLLGFLMPGICFPSTGICFPSIQLTKHVPGL